MTDLTLQITVKNGRLLRAMRGAGFQSVAAFARACGVNNSLIGQYLALKLPPITDGGEWRKSAQQMADFLRCMPEDLFPQAFLRARLETNRVEREVSADAAIGHMFGGARSIAYDPERSAIANEAQEVLREVLASLKPREAQVIMMRFGLDGPEHTLDECGRKLGVQKERVRQIEAKALRLMRGQHGEDRERKLRAAARDLAEIEGAA